MVFYPFVFCIVFVYQCCSLHMVILISVKAEEQGFSRFHLYVCAAFLVKWTDQLVKMDFQVCALWNLGTNHKLIGVKHTGNNDVSPSPPDEGLDRKRY